MELFPEFMRYGILRILNYLGRKIRDKKCGKILIYTNNQCQYPDWLRLILNYFNRKICHQGETIFDKPIAAFKINNCIVERDRTSHEKSHGDMINCAKLSPETEICFIDDTSYIDMFHANVYYIQPPPYHHQLTLKEVESRLLYSDFMTKLLKNNVVSRLFQMPLLYLSKSEFVSTPKEVYEELMEHIRSFFNLSIADGGTRKNRQRTKRFTRRTY